MALLMLKQTPKARNCLRRIHKMKYDPTFAEDYEVSAAQRLTTHHSSLTTTRHHSRHSPLTHHSPAPLTSTTHDASPPLPRRKAQFDLIIIETTGLANPAPVAQTFFADEAIKAFCRLDGIITMVDAKHVEQHLDEQKEDGAINEAIEQVATPNPDPDPNPKPKPARLHACLPASQPANQPANQPTNQPANQPTQPGRTWGRSLRVHTTAAACMI